MGKKFEKSAHLFDDFKCGKNALKIYQFIVNVVSIKSLN